MKRLLTLFFFMFALSSTSYAAPKKDEKCVACVTQKQRAQVQKKLDDLRERVRQLEEENRILRNRPQAVAEIPVERPFRATAPSDVSAPRKHRVSGWAGVGPDSLTNRRQEAAAGNEIATTTGPVVSAQYQYLLGDRISVGAQYQTTVRPKQKLRTYQAGLGFDF